MEKLKLYDLLQDLEEFRKKIYPLAIEDMDGPWYKELLNVLLLKPIPISFRVINNLSKLEKELINRIRSNETTNS